MPDLDRDTLRLEVAGEVERPLSLSLVDLRWAREHHPKWAAREFTDS